MSTLDYWALVALKCANVWIAFPPVKMVEVFAVGSELMANCGNDVL